MFAVCSTAAAVRAELSCAHLCMLRTLPHPTCSVEVQLVGDRKNTRVEKRILHLDVAAPALKLVRRSKCCIVLEDSPL